MHRSDTFPFTDPFITPSNSWGRRNAYAVMLSLRNDHCSPPDVRNVSDDRIQVQPSRGNRASCEIESTADGDVVFIEPSREDDIKYRNYPSCRSQSVPVGEWQSRSPQQDSKALKDYELRNPCSPRDHHQPSSHHRRHTRNLSSLFDATASIGRGDSFDSGELYNEDQYIYLDRDRKHRRDMSNGLTDQSNAHRRLNSIGNSLDIHRRPGHQREDSRGLDVLSAAVEATQEELAQAAGDQALPRRSQLDPRPSQHPVYSMRPYPPHPHAHHVTHSLPPPRHFVGPPHNRHFIPGQGSYNHPNYHNGFQQPYYTPGYASRPVYPLQHYPTQHSMQPPPPPNKGMMYPPEKRTHQHESYKEVQSPQKVADIEWPKSASSQDVPVEEKKETHPLKTEVTNVSNTLHHRHQSSFSSIGMGNILSASIMSPGVKGDQESHPLMTNSKPHHRSSSSVSFLNGLDVCGLAGSADETFLRNLQEATNNSYQSPTPMDSIPEDPPVSDVFTNANTNVASIGTSGSRLASGGTSKRVRRKCTVSGCINRVVQGGLCIAHGAKRKVCNHPGCVKNVKKAGLCSTHGPARRRCDMAGCSKVAVQGGRCIAHGAKKKVCEVNACDKQAILGGMCKKHHDQAMGKVSKSAAGGGRDGNGTDQQDGSMNNKPHHTRGLSIFHEIPATEIESIINTATTTDGTW